MSPNYLGSMDPRRPYLPPLIAPMPRQTMLASAAAGGVPMLQPGAAGVNNDNGYTYGQFPNSGVMSPDPAGEVTELPSGPPGAVEEYAGPPGAVEEVGGGEDQLGLANSALGKLFGGGNLQRGLAALGVGLSGLGPQQFQNPTLQRMVLQKLQQDQQQTGLARVFDAMTMASRAPNATEALAAYDRIIRDPSVANSPKLFEVALAQRTEMAKRAMTEGSAGRIASVMRSLGDNPTQEQLASAFANAGIPLDEQTRGIAGMFRKRNRDATLATGQPADIDTSTGSVTPYGPGRREVSGGFVVEPYAEQPVVNELPRTETLSPGQQLVRTAPGQRPSTVASVPERPTDQTRRGAEILGLDLSSGDKGQARMAATVGFLSEKYSREDLLTAASARTLGKLVPGLLAPEDADRVASSILAAEQGRRVEVSAQQGAGSVTARSRAEDELRIGETEASKYVMADGRYLPPRTPRKDVDALSARGEAAYVPYQFDREIIVRTKPLVGVLDRIDQVIDKRPDLFPKSAGMVPDLLNTTMAKAKAAMSAGVDPDVAFIKKSLAPYGALLNRYSGDSGNTALPERVANLAALGAEPSTHEVAKRMLQEIRQTLTDNLTTYGLDPKNFGVGVSRPGATPGDLSLPSGKTFR